MQFSTGEWVSLLHETGKFEFLRMDAFHAIVRDEMGFERKVERKFLVKRQPMAGGVVLKDNVSQKQPSKTVETPKSIDLHADALNLDHLPPHRLLEEQLAHCKRFLNDAIQKRIPKVLIIHGVGEGVLRQSIRAMLKHKKGIRCHDANYSQKGVGSTLVEIQVNSAERL